MRVKDLDGQLQLDIFEPPPKPKRTEYAQPCPIREDCSAYMVGCGGERGWCKRAQEAAKRGNPTWDDVQKGNAHLVDVTIPCKREGCYMFWNHGRCTHTAENYAYPMYRPNGMCATHKLVWND